MHTLSYDTTLLIDINDEVRTFISDIDSVVSDMRWDVKLWIWMYNLFYHDGACRDDLVEYYGRDYPITSQGKLSDYLTGEILHDRNSIAEYAIRYLYPALHLKLAYRDSDRPFISSVDLRISATGRIWCQVAVKDDH